MTETRSLANNRLDFRLICLGVGAGVHGRLGVIRQQREHPCAVNGGAVGRLQVERGHIAVGQRHLKARQRLIHPDQIQAQFTGAA